MSSLRDAVHQRFEARIVGVEPGVGGGVEEFPGVLTGPILRAGTMLEAIDERLLVDVQEAAFEIDAHAIAEDAVDVLTVEGGGREAVGDFVGDDGGFRRLGCQGGQRDEGR